MNEFVEKDPLNLVAEPQALGEGIFKGVMVKEARL